MLNPLPVFCNKTKSTDGGNISSEAMRARDHRLPQVLPRPLLVGNCCRRGGGAVAPAQVFGEIGGVITGAVDEGGLAAAQERQADDVESGRVHHATVVHDAALAIEHRNVEPGIVGTISGRPDHRAYTTVVQVETERRVRTDV